VRLPALSEQTAIASVLTALDAKIELNQRINAELEGMAKLLYDYWFVQFDFPMSAAQAAALGKPHLTGHPYRASGGQMIYNQTLKREIPQGWADGSLEKLGKIMGGSTPSTEVAEHFSSEGTPWITPKDLSDNVGNRFIDRGAMGVTEKGIKAASLKLLPAGTVLMSSRAPIGYLAVARNPVTTNQGFKSFVPAGGYSTDYIHYTLKHFMKLIHVNASGSTFKEISGGTLKAVRIHLPPVDLVKKFTEFSSSLSAQQSVLEQQNQELTQLRDWLLPMLMNGQVTVG
jgi:type I restriction enzyme S subunit